MSKRRARRRPTSKRATSPPQSAPLIEEPEAETGGYALKFGRRRKTKSVAVIAAERKAARVDALAKKQRHRLIWMTLKLLVPGLIVVAVLSILGSGVGERVSLPKALEPAAFAGLVEFSTTERIGALFQGTLHSAPSPEPAAHADFRSRVEAIASTLGKTGYESLLIIGPDGTTLASGTVTDISFAPAGALGT